MFTYEYVKTPPVEGFYWVLPAVGEEWMISFIDMTALDLLSEQYPKAEFCGPIPKPRPRDAIRLGKGAMKINRNKPVRKI